MAITRNLITAADIDKAFVGPTWCFPAVKSDDNYLEDPYYSGVVEQEKAIVAAAISLSREDEDIKVEFWNKRVVIIPAGTLLAGIPYKLPIVKLWSTGTGVSVDVLIWQGQDFRNA